MTEPIKVSYIFNDKNYHGAYAAHLWCRQKPWIITRSILCVLMVLFGGYLMTVTEADRIFGYAFVTGGSVGLLRPMIWQMWHERGVRKHAAFGSKMKFTFDSEGVQIDGKQGNIQLAWDNIFQVVKAKKGILIYVSKKKYLWIPRSQLSQAEVDSIFLML